MRRIGLVALTDTEKQTRYRKTHLVQEKVKLRRFQLDHPEFCAIDAAKQRCTNPNNPQYKNYGARGIECRINYKELIAAIGPRPNSLYSIDRINNDGHYEAGNLRWATHKQQMANRRD